MNSGFKPENKATDQKLLATSSADQSPRRGLSTLHESNPLLTNQLNFKDRGEKMNFKAVSRKQTLFHNKSSSRSVVQSFWQLEREKFR